MSSCLSNNTFHTIGVPIIFVLIGVLANRLGRRDGDDSPLKNFWAVGTSFFLMSLGAVFAEIRTVSQTDQSKYLMWTIIFLVCLLASLDWDRYVSWERDDQGNPTESKRMFLGIVLPDIISILIFVVYRVTVL